MRQRTYGALNEDTYGPARDGGVFVMQEKCKTCIFRPGNIMNLSAGRVASMKREADKDGTCIICHETMDSPQAAVCRGYYDKHKSSLLQIAERLGMIREQENPA